MDRKYLNPEFLLGRKRARRIALSIAGIALAAHFPFLASAQNGINRYDSNPNGNENRISCSSENGQRVYCDADTRGGVQLSRRLGRAACQQGSSWGYDRRGIWVDRGCRAEFTVAGFAFKGREKTVGVG